ncbi:MAG: type III-A CRISPR-associated RAMP protein Csm4 [Chlorobiaceae bacterium]|nr:type III-A CRISPR-associated RAMP protein Csm4 [Chlorobiaceae bacterium]
MPESVKHYIVRLKFTSPIRFGADNSGIGIEDSQPFVHSDTLFSALCNAWAKYGILTNDELALCCETFVLSSTSFYAYQGSATYFIPKPFIPSIWLKELKSSKKEQLEKIIKKAHWVTSDMFKHWLDPKPPSGVFPDNPNNLSEKLDYGSLFRKHIVTKHTQDRVTAASNLFYESQYEFKDAPTCGLYFLVSLKNDLFKEKFNLGLKALSQIGLGGERNFGLGRFEIGNGNGILCPIETDGSNLGYLFDVGLSTLRCLFSLSLPTQAEADTLKGITNDQVAHYDIVLRKGWTFSSVNLYQMKRQTIYMLLEGSVFEESLCPVGQIENVAPLDEQNNIDFPHPVFRFGKSFWVLLKSY